MLVHEDSSHISVSFHNLICQILFQNVENESNSDMKEKCLGFISLGKSVTGEKEKAHWFSVMSAPRKVFTSSFKLE